MNSFDRAGSRVPDFWLIVNESQGILSHDVQQALLNGWKLHGPPMVVRIGFWGREYSQAVVYQPRSTEQPR